MSWPGAAPPRLMLSVESRRWCSPLGFISRLTALVPKPRTNPGPSPGQALTRYHGVFALNCQYRARVTPARRGRGNKAKAPGLCRSETTMPPTRPWLNGKLPKCFAISMMGYPWFSSEQNAVGFHPQRQVKVEQARYELAVARGTVIDTKTV